MMLEIELVDVFLVEGERLTEQDVVVANFHRSQSTGWQRFVTRLERRCKVRPRRRP